MKLALADYFIAADIVAVFVSSSDNGKFTLRFDRVGNENAIWVEAHLATKIIGQAEQLVGAAGSSSQVEIVQLQELLYRAAFMCGAHPTPHHVVIDKAQGAIRRLDQWLEAANASGMLGAFNEEFRRRRKQAVASGARTMTFASARRRLRRSLMRRLISGNAAHGGLLGEVFPCQSKRVC